jgi:hypothetical protein
MIDEKPFTPSKATDPKYQLLMELGRGGMGVVHLAMSRGPQGFTKLVVLKMMRKQLVGDAESHRMFLEEARISARLQHPNIVHVYEVIEFEGTPTLVMEYLEGQTFWSIVRNPALKMRVPLQLQVFSKVLAGLHAAHELRDFDGTPLDLIHRDVSPHNVFVLFDGQVKVLDFGIAKATGSEVETRAGVLKGKIRYMPPEQLLRDTQDRRVDIFAVGVMLWETLSGRRYWGDLKEEDVASRLLARQLPPLPDDVEIAPELATMCERALAPMAADRYTTAGELQRDLEDYLARQPDRSSADEVGAFMRQHFGAEREAAARVIEAHVREVERAHEVVTEGETRVISPGHGTPSPTATITARTWRPRKVLALGAVALVVVVGGMALLLGGRGAGSGKKPGANSAIAAWSQTVGDNAGAQALVCPQTFKACEGQCVSVDRPDVGCGDAACHACNVQNATARCNQFHRCDIAVCYQDFDDCDGDSTNGCETNVRIDPDHCGGCGRKCPALSHAQRGCGDACTIWRCDSGYRDCNAAVADGCEVNVTSDSANCGQCGRACKGGQKCRHGTCS